MRRIRLTFMSATGFWRKISAAAATKTFTFNETRVSSKINQILCETSFLFWLCSPLPSY